MSNYPDLVSLEKQAEILLKERPEEIQKLADELEKIIEDHKKKGIDFKFEDLFSMLPQEDSNLK